MATVLLDDTDPIDAIVLEHREEMRGVRDRGGFYGSTISEVNWQASQISDDLLTVKRRKKRFAQPKGK